MAEKDLELTIGIPSKGECDISFAYGLTQLVMYSMGHEDSPFKSYQLMTQVSSIVDMNRNRLVQRMSGDYILFLDDDVLPPADLALRLLRHKKEVVSGLYFNRHEPFHPQAFLSAKDNDWRYDCVQEPKDLMEVDAFGMGAALIKKEVFEKLHEPYFKTVLNEETGNRKLGEDLYFCRKVKEAGYSLWVDANAVCGHIGRDVIGARHWDAYRNRLKQIEKELGPEEFAAMKKKWRDPE